MTCKPKWPFLLGYGSHDTRRIDFHGLTGSQRTPGFLGRDSLVSKPRFINT